MSERGDPSPGAQRQELGDAAVLRARAARRSATSATCRPARSRRCGTPTRSAARTPAGPGRLLERAGVARRAPLLVVNDHTEARRSVRCSRRLRARRARRGGDRRRHAGHLRSRRAAGARGRRRQGSRSRSFPVRRLRSPRWWRAACRPGRFVFEGFLPRKGSGRTRASARRWPPSRARSSLYEAPHRLARTLADLVGRARRRPAGRGGARAHQAARRGGARHVGRRASTGLLVPRREASTSW